MKPIRVLGILAFTVIAAAAIVSLCGCTKSVDLPPVSDSGVKKVKADIEIGQDGMTNEQRNIFSRYKEENSGAVKHLYVISPYSGDVLIYSTVKGKITSGGKRLTPKTVFTSDPYQGTRWGTRININGQVHLTSEVLQDDGTYGDSCEYIYWFDSKGVYHQHLFTGGQIIHVSAQPIRVGKVIINMEVNKDD